MKRAFASLVVLAGLCGAQTPDSAEAHLGRGEKLMQDQLFAAAASEFEQALALDGAELRARFPYAVCLLTLGRNDEARRQFERVREQAGDLPGLMYYLGRLDLLGNDYAAAIKRLGAVAENPPFPDTAFHLGVAYMSAGDTATAVKWLERAARLTPNDYRVHYRLARAYSSSGREPEAGREYALYSRLRDERKNTETQARACTDALRTQPAAAARAVCRRMFDANDPEKLTLLGQLLGDAGAFSDAVEPLRRAVELDASSFEAWHNLGLTYFRLQKYRDAREPLEKAVKLRPEFYGSVVLLGATLYMLGEDDAALPVLERAHRLNPSDAQTAAVLEKLRGSRRKK
jgi:tetratricopeptide (TPR) repeat protein